MRILFIALVALACASGAGAQDDKKYESKDGKFAAKFPGSPKTKTEKAENLTLIETIAEKDKTGFAVIYADLSDTALKAGADKLFEGAQNGMVNKIKVTVTKSAAFTVKSNGSEFPAREIRAEKEKEEKHYRITLILAGSRMYQVIVIGEKDVVNGKDADAFVKSFEITK